MYSIYYFRYFKIGILLFAISFSYGDDYYELLGIKRDANDKEIRKAFKKLAITLHPDKNTVNQYIPAFENIIGIFIDVPRI